MSQPSAREVPLYDIAFDPVGNPSRFAEVCMVVRRPTGTLLLSIKTFYPRGAYRLPTNPPPEYPADARAQGREGTVLLSLALETDGRVSSATLHASSGWPALDEAALAAARAWSPSGLVMVRVQLEPSSFSSVPVV